MDNQEKEEKTIESTEISTEKEIPEEKVETEEVALPKETEEPKEDSKEENVNPFEVPKEEEPSKEKEEPKESEETSTEKPVTEESPKEETPAEESQGEVDEEAAVKEPEEKSSEEEKEEVKIQGKEMEAADFTSMFNVASEETPDGEPIKDVPKKSEEVDPDATIIIPVQKEEVKIQGKEMEAADFSSTFNVASEETPDGVPIKDEPKKSEEVDPDATVIIPIKKDDAQIQGKEMEAADFTSMFNVASEEVKEEPKVEVPTAPAEEAKAAPVEPAPIPTEVIEARKTPRFNSEEKTLYTIKEEKESNPLGVVLFFIILAAVIVFLPQLTKTSEAALDKIYGKGVNPTEQKEEEKVETKYYYFEQTLEYQLDNLTITNAIKSKTGNEYFLTMTIFNNESRAYTYDKNYYIILYNENQILSRTKFFSYDAIAPNGANEVSFVINKGAKDSANRFAIVLVDKNEYPEVNLYVEEGDYKVLTCTYLNDELKYYFKDDKLTKIRERYVEEKTKYTTEYDKNKETFKELSRKYNAIDHFESVFIERDYEVDEEQDKDPEHPKVRGEFEMVNDLDLVNITDKSLSNLKTFKFFSYNESKDVVSYEVSSIGYTCGN